MNFLITEDEISIINFDDIKLDKQIPLGFWKLSWDKAKGIFLSKTDFKLSHGKIYGESQNIANHIISAYKTGFSSKNLGVLLSGGRGLGKTLTTRLIIEQLSKNYPVIIVSEYFSGLPQFMENIKNCVILMDEFEKFMSGNISNSDNEDEQTKQESILSLLDGNTGCAGNLFLLTVNNIYKLDDNLRSRPGRIKYHYKFTSESSDVIREYCKDNLNDKTLIDEVVSTLSHVNFISMDIITAFVDELNMFPENKPRDILNYLNIETGSNKYKFTFIIKDPSTNNIYAFERVGDNLYNDRVGLTPKDSLRYEASNDTYLKVIFATVDIPLIVYDKTKLTYSDFSIDSIYDSNDHRVDNQELEILDAYIEDMTFKKRMKHLIC